MIPDRIKRDHVLAAMRTIDREGIPHTRDSSKFQVAYGVRRYPPKLLISIAYKHAAKRATLHPSRFSGGKESNNFLGQLGFTIILKGKSGTRSKLKPHQGKSKISSKRGPTLHDPRVAPLAKQLLHKSPLYTWAKIKKSNTIPPSTSGVYAWFFKQVPPRVPIKGCFRRSRMPLLYVGISPSPRRPISKASLHDRIHTHFRGQAESSTLRFTLGSLLKKKLKTILHCEVSSGRKTFQSKEDALNIWMAKNARVAWIETSTKANQAVEEFLIRSLELPLNIQGNSNHCFCSTLKSIRASALKQARARLRRKGT
jgi:hypothetical protein